MHSSRNGIPTGKYQLTRLATPLDPNPRGPVFDGGLMVDAGMTNVLSSEQPNPSLSQAAPVSSAALTPAELRNKYTVTDIPQNWVAVLTIPRQTTLADALVDAYRVRAAANKPQAVSDDTFSMLIQTGRFNEAFSSPTTIGICGFIPRTDLLRGQHLKNYLTDKGVKLPCIEHLVAACMIHHSVTGRHLVPDGRVTRVLDGVIERKGSQLHIHFDDLEKFDTSPKLVVAGKVKPGQQSALVGRFDGLMQHVKAIFGVR
jgi:hypothetical protein